MKVQQQTFQYIGNKEPTAMDSNKPSVVVAMLPVVIDYWCHFDLQRNTSSRYHATQMSYATLAR